MQDRNTAPGPQGPAALTRKPCNSSVYFEYRAVHWLLWVMLVVTDTFSSHTIISPSKLKKQACIFTAESREYVALQAKCKVWEKRNVPKIPRLETNQRRPLFYIYIYNLFLAGIRCELWVAFNCCTAYGIRKRCAEHYQFHGKQMEIGCEKILCRADKWPKMCEKKPLEIAHL